MKNNTKLLTVLNQILIDELKEFNQNKRHSKLSNKMGYGEVYDEINKEIEGETFEELKQAEWLIKRIIFFEVWRTRQPLVSVSQNNSKESNQKLSNFGGTR